MDRGDCIDPALPSNTLLLIQTINAPMLPDGIGRECARLIAADCD
jgi:hypothetical protein